MVDSLNRLEDDFGTEWIENAIFHPPGNYGIELLVDFERCLRRNRRVSTLDIYVES